VDERDEQLAEVLAEKLQGESPEKVREVVTLLLGLAERSRAKVKP
jgi:hypothetical protein